MRAIHVASHREIMSGTEDTTSIPVQLAKLLSDWLTTRSGVRAPRNAADIALEKYLRQHVVFTHEDPDGET